MNLDDYRGVGVNLDDYQAALDLQINDPTLGSTPENPKVWPDGRCWVSWPSRCPNPAKWVWSRTRHDHVAYCESCYPLAYRDGKRFLVGPYPYVARVDEEWN